MGNMRKLLKRSPIQRLNTLRLYVLLAPKSPSANVARYRIFFDPRKNRTKSSSHISKKPNGKHPTAKAYAF